MSLWSDITNTATAVYDFGKDVWDTGSQIASNVWDAANTPGTQSLFTGTSLSGGWLDSTTMAIGSFLDNPIVKAGAGYALNSMVSKDGTLNSPSVKGSRMSGSARQSSGSSQFSASAADLGFTDRVQNAMRTIRNSNVGSGTIQDTVARLQSRPARGPLLDITAPQVAVRSTTKQSRD